MYKMFSAALFALLMGAQSASAQNLYTIPVDIADPPTGYIGFCERYAEKCIPKSLKPEFIELTDENRAILQAVNNRVNDSIIQITDKRHWGIEDRWDLAEDGKGDCEDLALLKQDLLLAKGFPTQALLITVVLNHGEGHAVLSVMTDRGEIILDNRTRIMVRWYETDYTFISRQSAWDHTKWVSLRRTQPASAVAAQ